MKVEEEVGAAVVAVTAVAVVAVHEFSGDVAFWRQKKRP